jgi:type I restriction enzyme M protein
LSGFTDWRKATTPRLTGFAKDDHPKALIETIAEDLLTRFRQTPLIDAYDVYQHLMDYWSETMQDDVYLIAADGWVKGAQPREIVQVKNKDNKLAWPEPHDYLKGKRRFKSDLVPAPILVARYFAAERDAIDALDNALAVIEQQLDEMREENRMEGVQAGRIPALDLRVRQRGGRCAGDRPERQGCGRRSHGREEAASGPAEQDP